MSVYTYAITSARRALRLSVDAVSQFPGLAGSAWTLVGTRPHETVTLWALLLLLLLGPNFFTSSVYPEDFL